MYIYMYVSSLYFKRWHYGPWFIIHDLSYRLSNSNDSDAIQIKNDKTENQTSTEMKSNARRNEFSFTSFEMLTLIFVSVFFKCFIH